MSLEKLLTPHLAREMPDVAWALPWLLLLEGVIVAGALIASFSLMYSAARYTAEDTEKMQTLLPTLLDGHRILRRVRYVLIGFAALVLITGGGLWLAGSLDPEWVELVFSVICASIILPNYFAVSLLERSFRYFAARLRELPA